MRNGLETFVNFGGGYCGITSLSLAHKNIMQGM